MKKAQILLVFFLVCGCKQEDAKKVESESLTQTIENVSTVSKMANSASDISKHVEELSKLTPVDNESLKKVFPEHLMGNQLMEYSVGKAGMVNIAMGEAKYQLEKETKKIEVKITDGAGVGSSLIAAVFFALNTGLEKKPKTLLKELLK